METQYVGGNRSILKNILPLEIPLGIEISLIQGICNLKCKYCQQSVGGFGEGKKYFPLDILDKQLYIMQENKWKIRQILLGGGGEPLLHPQLIQIVENIVVSGITESVVLVTNGTLLTKDYCEKLLNTNINNIRISLNGLSGEEYYNNTGVKINFDEMIENLTFLYKNKCNTKIYIKIMDYMLGNKQREQIFRDIFQGICDQIGIEQVFQASKEIDYTNYITEKDINIHGANKVILDVCPIPFYSLNINTDATVSPCCEAGIWYKKPQLVLGDLQKESIVDIWKGEKLNELYVQLLKKGVQWNTICSQCDAYRNQSYEEDSLDSIRKILLEKYKKK